MKKRVAFVLPFMGTLLSTYSLATNDDFFEKAGPKVMHGIISFVTSDIFIFVALALMIFILVTFLRSLFPKKSDLPDYMPERHGNLVADFEEVSILHEIQKTDPSFDKESFSMFAKKIFLNVERAWTQRNAELLKMYEDVHLLEQHTEQIESFKKRRQVNVTDMIVVRNVNLYTFEQKNGIEKLGVLLTCSLIDYTKNELTNTIISGNEQERVNQTYLMEFTRRQGIITNEYVDTEKVVECPNCGAQTKLTSVGECRECGIFIRTNVDDWLLSNIEPFETV